MKTEKLVQWGMSLAGIWLGALFFFGGKGVSWSGAGSVVEWGMEEVRNPPSGVVLMDFYSPSCGPCRQMASILDDAADEFSGSIMVAKINVDRVQEAAIEYGVQMVPTMVVMKNGKVMDRWVGTMPKKELLSRVRGY